jgi:predicted TIM-barrel fold metal-dependent hydrolase
VNKRAGAEDPEHFTKETDLSSFVKEMQNAGITKGVIIGRSIPICPVPNERIAEFVSQYPEQLFGVAGIDPTNTIHNSLTEIEHCVRELGLKGIVMDPGLSADNLYPNDKKLYPIFNKCVELNVPVVFMTGPFSGPNLDYNRPVWFDIVANDFPQLDIVCGHACWPFVEEMIGVAFKHENVYISPDLYTFNCWADQYVKAANTFLQDQFLFGTGYPFRPFKQTVDDFFALPFDDKVVEKLLFRNAEKVLRL